MINKQQLTVVVKELQQTILNLIDKNIILQQSKKQYVKVNAIMLQKQIDQLKIKMKSVNIQLDQALSKLTNSQKLVKQLQVQLQQKNNKINAYNSQMKNKNSMIKEFQEKNKQLENDLNDLNTTLQQKNLLEQIKRKQSDVQYDASSQLKDLQLSPELQVKVYMLLFNKEKKNRELKKQNSRLNEYLSDITKNEKYQKNINWKLIQDQVQKQVKIIDKQIKKQFHLIINCNNDNDRNQVSNNLQILLKNYQREIDSLFLNNVK